jgi:uncharacterized DUF497 family protein
MKLMSTEKFVWDKDKALANERKHGISFKLAATVFYDPLIEIFHNADHEGSEERWSIVGMAENSVIVLVVCTFGEEGGDDRVRIISARKATFRERREYESGEYTIREPVMTDEYDEQYEKAEGEFELDFSKGVRGKFAHVRFPIFIDNSILGYFHGRAIASGIPGEELINEVLRQHVAATGYVAPVFTEGR